MMIDWQASKEDWIKRVQNDLFPDLRGDVRFPDAKILINRFATARVQFHSLR